jgi:hypothetical protein
VTCAGGYVYQLRFDVRGHNAQCLNCVHDEKSVVAACSASESFQIDAKSGCKLHVTDCDHSCLVVDQAFQLRRIDTTFSLVAHSHFNTKGVAYPKPGIDIRWKLTAECDDVVTWLPGNAVGDGRETIRGVAHESNLLGPGGAEKFSEALSCLLFNRQPATEVCGAVFMNIFELRLNRANARNRRWRDCSMIEIDRSLRDGK